VVLRYGRKWGVAESGCIDLDPVNKRAFIAALKSAVIHLHSFGLAHSGVDPVSILAAVGDLLALVDFGSCHEIGSKLATSCGTPGWVNDGEEYATSETHHDIFAIGKIQVWLGEPTFACSLERRAAIV